MLTAEQLQERQSAVGGSDLAAILGVSPYAQAIDVFYDKRPDLADEHGYIPRVVDGFAVDRGNLFEDPIAKLVEKKTGQKVRKSNVRHVHPQYPWLAANIDRKWEGEKRGLEIKTVTHRLAHLWGKEGTDQVAEYYLPQPHHYMLVLDYPVWDLAALIGIDDLRLYEIERDPEMDELIIDVSHDFWHENVLKGIPPEIDLDHPKASDLMKRLYRGIDGQVILDESAAHWLSVMNEAREIEKQYGVVADNARLHLQKLAGNAGKIFIPGVQGGFTRKEVKRKGYEVEPSSYIDFRFSKTLKPEE